MRRGLEARPGPLQYVGGRQQAARVGARGEPCCEIDRVAHDVVGAARLGADVPAERRAAVDTGAQRQPLVGPENGAERTQHALLVGARRRRRPADDVDLAAALVDVRPEPGQAQLLELVAEKLREPRQVAVHRLGAVGRNFLVDARELEERGGDLSVLRLAGLEQQVSAERRRYVQLDLVRQLAGGRRRAFRDLPLRKLEEEPAVSSRRPHPVRRQRGGRPLAEQDLPRLGTRLELDRRGRCGACDHQLAVGALDEEEVTGAGVDAGRHPQGHRADRAHHLPRRPDQPLHIGRGVAGPVLVLLSVEEQEECVTPELEHVPVVALSDPDQTLEDAGDGERQLFRAGPALRLQPLGKRGEAREVDGDQRSLDLAHTETTLPAPVQHEPGQVWGERRHLPILVFRMGSDLDPLKVIKKP